MHLVDMKRFSGMYNDSHLVLQCLMEALAMIEDSCSKSVLAYGAEEVH